MSKKVIGALLAIFMVLSVFSFTVFAVSTGYEAEGSTNKQTWGLANKVAGSDGTYTVDVILSTNYKVGPIQFKITGVDSITKVDVNETAYYAATENHNSSGLVILTPDTSADLLGKELSNAVVATVTYTSSQNGTPAIEENVKSAFNPQGSLMAARLEGSDYVNKATSFIVGQEATVVPLGGEMPEPPATEAADLAVKSGVTGVVIDTNKTFGGQYDGVILGIPAKDSGATKLTSGDYYKDFVEATNGGSVTVVKSIYSGRAASWGTGTQIEVYNADSSLSKTYIIVLFGDVNGDSLIENTDIGLVLAEAMSPSLPDIQKMAANCYAPSRGTATVIADALYNVDNTDIGLVLQQAMQYDALDFAALAAKHAQYNNYYQ